MMTITITGMTSGTFHLFPEAHLLPASEGPKMLGSICELVDYPISQRYPRNPWALIEGETVEICLGSAEFVVASAIQRNPTLALELAPLLKAAYIKDDSATYSLNSQWIRTVTLVQQRDAFKTLMQNDATTKQKVTEILKAGRPLYMMVAYRTCTSTYIRQESSSGRLTDLSLAIPISTLLAAIPALAPFAAMIPIPMVTVNKQVKNVAVVDLYAPDEMIFAAEYREILLWRTFVDRFVGRGTNVEVGDIHKGTGPMMDTDDESVSPEEELTAEEQLTDQEGKPVIEVGNGLKAYPSDIEEGGGPVILREIGADEVVPKGFAAIQFGDL